MTHPIDPNAAHDFATDAAGAADAAHVAHGQLCIWTDIDPDAEPDFNAWYDREHMQERVALPGFRFARRFIASDGRARRYLALYVTESLDVFRSDTYHRSFTSQTEWSLRNFSRMIDTQRRVGTLSIEAGEGEGARLAMFVVPQSANPAGNLDTWLDTWRARLGAAVKLPGIHAARLFCTEPSLSVPLKTGSTASATTVAADALVLVEGSDASATRILAAELAGQAGVAATDVRTFDLLWRLEA